MARRGSYRWSDGEDRFRDPAVVRFGAQQYGAGHCRYLQAIAVDSVDICRKRDVLALGAFAQRPGSCCSLSDCYADAAIGAGLGFGRGGGGRVLGASLTVACPTWGAGSWPCSTVVSPGGWSYFCLLPDA